MQDFFKRYWFILVVGVLFAVAIGYFALDQSKDVLKGKSKDGKDVVFEINEELITADALYEKMVDEFGISAAFSLIERAVVEQKGELTEDIKSEAKIQAESTIANFKEYYKDDYENVLLQSLKSVGYEKVEDLQNYFQHLIMLDELTVNYLFENEEKYVVPFLTSNKPRIISHILIAMDDPTKPTEEEQKRWDNAIAALESGKTFQEVAKESSDDTASATNNGSLGYVDANTEFVPEFLKAALALDQENTRSEWVKTDYGYHLIQLDTADLDDLKKETGFKNALVSANRPAQQLFIWNSAKELGLDFYENNELKEQLETYINGLEKE